VIGIPLSPRSVADLAARHGGEIKGGGAPSVRERVVRRLVPIGRAGAGDLTVLLHPRYVDDAKKAIARGAILLVDMSLASAEIGDIAGWFHAHASYVLAELLELGDAPADAPMYGDDCKIHPTAIVLPRVRIGSRVTIGPGAVVGAAGFGFAPGPDGKVKEIPQIGGVVIEDDVFIGALSTIASGTIGPTIIRAGAKIDAQVHIAHNCDIGEGTMIAAQTGIAGSVVVGKGVLIGGQVGIADHLTIGDGARLAAKSGVIGDVAPNATVAGYPAVDRHRWLRGLAEMYRMAAGRSGAPSSPSSSGSMRASGITTEPSPPPGGVVVTAPTIPAPPSGRSDPLPPPAKLPGGIHPAAVIRRTEPPESSIEARPGATPPPVIVNHSTDKRSR
jgi:UDP-3-O-[3-hydroxymyristoyl] glucosamine N-acyltransferase